MMYEKFKNVLFLYSFLCPFVSAQVSNDYAQGQFSNYIDILISFVVPFIIFILVDYEYETDGTYEVAYLARSFVYLVNVGLQQEIAFTISSIKVSNFIKLLQHIVTGLIGLKVIINFIIVLNAKKNKNKTKLNLSRYIKKLFKKLFGKKYQAFETKIQTLKKSVETQFQILYESVKTLEEKIKTQIQSLVEKVKIQIQSFEENVEKQIKSFEEKVKTQIQSFEEKVKIQIKLLEEKVKAQIQSFEEKVKIQIQSFEEKVEKQIQSFEEKVENQIQSFEEKIEKQIKQIQSLENKFQTLETKFKILEKRGETKFQTLVERIINLGLDIQVMDSSAYSENYYGKQMLKSSHNILSPEALDDESQASIKPFKNVVRPVPIKENFKFDIPKLLELKKDEIPKYIKILIRTLFILDYSALILFTILLGFLLNDLKENITQNFIITLIISISLTFIFHSSILFLSYYRKNLENYIKFKIAYDIITPKYHTYIDIIAEFISINVLYLPSLINCFLLQTPEIFNKIFLNLSALLVTSQIVLMYKNILNKKR